MVRIGWALLTCALSACSAGSGDAGGGGNGNGGGGGQGAEESSLAEKADVDDDDVRHFLARTHFGFRQADLDAVEADGLAAYVDAMLELPARGSMPWEAEAQLLLEDESDPNGLEGMFPSATDLARWWMYLMMHSEHPFQEELAFFWHDHFAVSTSVLNDQELHWMRDTVELFRAQGTGNLRDLLVSVSRDPATARWLDQTINNQFNINENYAREFWELFTLGVDNGYGQDDIRESSEAHTGFSISFDPDTNLSSVVFIPQLHSDGAKSFLDGSVAGQHGAGDDEHDDIAAVVDITLAFEPPSGRGTAEYICETILEHYYGDEPPVELVDGLAAVLRDNDWELKPVFATLFKSEAFFSPRAKEPIARNPVEGGIGFLRSTGLFVPVDVIDNSLLLARHRPTQPPDVSGWVEGEELFASMAMLEGANLACDAIESRAYQRDELGLDDADLLPPGADPGSSDVVDYWAPMLGVALSNADRNTLIEYMDTRRLLDGSVVPSPFDGSNPEHLDERLRGLLYILAQHPTYVLR